MRISIKTIPLAGVAAYGKRLFNDWVQLNKFNANLFESFWKAPHSLSTSSRILIIVSMTLYIDVVSISCRANEPNKRRAEIARPVEIRIIVGSSRRNLYGDIVGTPSAPLLGEDIVVIGWQNGLLGQARVPAC